MLQVAVVQVIFKPERQQKEWRRPRGCRHSPVAAYQSARPAGSDFDGGNGASALRFLPPPLYRPAIRGERKHRVVPNAVPTFALPLRIGWRALGSRKTDPSLPEWSLPALRDPQQRAPAAPLEGASGHQRDCESNCGRQERAARSVRDLSGGRPKQRRHR